MTTNRHRNDGHRETDLEQPLLAEEASDEQQASEQQQEEEQPLPSISRLVWLGQPEFCILTLAGILMMFSQISQLFIPLLVGRAYDDLVDPTLEHKMKSINELMFWALIIHVTGALASGLRSTLMGIAGERIVARMRTTLYSSILKQEIAFFDATKSGELVSRLGSDTMVVKRAIASSWAEVVLGLFRLIATLALMFVISPKLAGLTVGSTFAVFVVCLPFGKMLGKLSKSYQETLGEAQNYPTEVISAMRTVKSFGAEPKEADRYRQKIGVPSYCPGRSEVTTFRIGYDQSVVRAAFGFAIFGGGFGAMYGTLWYGFSLVHQHELKLGDLSAFQAYILGIGGILAHMSSSFSNLIEARHASQRIFGLLDREPKIANHPSAATTAMSTTAARKEKQSSSIGEKISFEGVSFSYPTRPNVPVLENFSLSIPKDKTTAIVGPSGAGKSTILSLLERFYDAQEGSILLDGVDLRQLELQQLRKQLGYVQQEPTLFGLSVRENLCYGLPTSQTISDDALLEACRTANAYDFVRRLPNGLDELIGERGVTLSGGQKQRLAIARAILLRPSILLLDEATSALDAESEFLVQQAMEAASKGRTVVVVAHRLSTIQRADQIVVLEDHTLCDAGTHEELMKRCVTYQTLIARQSFGSSYNTSSSPATSPSRKTRAKNTASPLKRPPTSTPLKKSPISRQTSPTKSPIPSNTAKRQEERLKSRANKDNKQTSNDSTVGQTSLLRKSPSSKSRKPKSPVRPKLMHQEERLKTKAKKTDKPATTNGLETNTASKLHMKNKGLAPGVTSLKSPSHSTAAGSQEERLNDNANKTEKRATTNGSTNEQTKTIPKIIVPSTTTTRQEEQIDSKTNSSDKAVANALASIPASATPSSAASTPRSDEIVYEEKFRKWSESKKKKK